MTEYARVDLLAVFLAAVVNLIIGSCWYSRWLFGELWMQLSDSSLEKRSMAVFSSCITAFISSYSLALLLSLLGVTTVLDGMFVGFLIWVGFVATTQFSRVVWGNVSFKLFLLETGCRLFTLVAMGGLLGV